MNAVWLSLFDLEGGAKVISDHIRRPPALDYLQVSFTYPKSRTINIDL